jgi:hypothetical protein
MRCAVNADRGSTSVIASGIPNGPATLQRIVEGRAAYTLRGGAFTVENGGFSKEDPEAPFGVPLRYQLTVAPPETLVQTNSVLTPSFTRGAQGWRAGAGRTLSVVSSAGAASPLVGAVTGNPAGVTPDYPAPTVIGSVSATSTGTTMTLTPTGTVAVGDWVYLVLHQVAGAGADTATVTAAGFSLLFKSVGGTVDVAVWRRRRAASDGGYTLPNLPSGTKLGLLVWVRGGSDTFVPTVGAVGTGAGTVTDLPIPVVPTVARPSLLLTVLAVELVTGATGRADTITGTSQRFTSDSGRRHTTIGAVPLADTGLAPRTPATIPQGASSAVGVQIVVPADAPMTQRIIATTPTGALPASGVPYRLTGRVKFRASDLWLWQDVLDQGTWANLRATKTSWANVRSTSSSPSAAYMRLYVDIAVTYNNLTTLPGTSAEWDAWAQGVADASPATPTETTRAAIEVLNTGVRPVNYDPVRSPLASPKDLLMQLLIDIHNTPTRAAYLLAGSPLPQELLAVAVRAAYWMRRPIVADPTAVTGPVTQVYVAPVQVIVADAARTNQWIDFSFLFTVGQDIPAGAQIRLTHGTNPKEYATTWQFDQLGITGADSLAEHDPVYWFSGDSPVPPRPEDRLLPDGSWSDASGDSRVQWLGAAGNSVSVFYGPSRVMTESTCQVDAPDAPDLQSPVYVNDPIAPGRGGWFTLVSVGDLVYTARRSLMDVLGRGPQIAVSQTRGWPSGNLTLLSRDAPARARALSTFQTGRILLVRNPDPRYPEDAWYVSIGDVTEQRLPNGDQTRMERLWQVPFVQVERPVGLIEQAAGQTWAQVAAKWSDWAGVRRDNATWLDLLYPTEGFTPPTTNDGALFPGSPAAYPSLATFPST